MSSDNLDHLLHYDALEQAEKLTGLSRYLDEFEFDDDGLLPRKHFFRSGDRNDLFMILSMQNGKRKENALTKARDTGGSDRSPAYFQQVLRENGFILDLHEEGVNPSWKKYDIEKEFCEVWYHPTDAIVVIFDTYWNFKSVNSAKAFYQLRAKPEARNPNGTSNDERFWQATSSGGWNQELGKSRDTLVYCGDHDAREGLIHNLNKLRACADFVNPWVETEYNRTPWFVVWEGPDSYDGKFDYTAASMERIMRCPNASRIMGFVPISENSEPIDSQLDRPEYNSPIESNSNQIEESQVSENDIQIRAYHLWEKAGRPDGCSEHFWWVATEQLTPRDWTVSSGDLQVSGNGTYDDVLLLAMNSADFNGISLADKITIGNFSDGGVNFENTEETLKRFGLWPSVVE